MENNRSLAVAGEGVDEPVLYNFGPYGYVRYQCPFDRQLMENQTRSFSHFGVGTFRCLDGHEWKHDSDRLWTPTEEAALAQNLVAVGESLAQTKAILDRLEAEIAAVTVSEALLARSRDEAFDEAMDTIRQAQARIRAVCDFEAAS